MKLSKTNKIYIGYSILRGPSSDLAARRPRKLLTLWPVWSQRTDQRSFWIRFLWSYERETQPTLLAQGGQCHLRWQSCWNRLQLSRSRRSPEHPIWSCRWPVRIPPPILRSIPSLSAKWLLCFWRILCWEMGTNNLQAHPWHESDFREQDQPCWPWYRKWMDRTRRSSHLCRIPVPG